MAQGPNRAEVSIGARIDEVVAAITELQNQFSSFSKNASEKLNSIGLAGERLVNRIREIGTAWLSWEGAKHFFEATVESSEKLNVELGRLAATLGVSTKEAAALKIGLDDIGVGTDSYVGVLQRMTLQVRTNEDRMHQLGLVTRDANGQYLNGAQLIENARKALLEYREGMDRNLAASEMTGRSWAQFTDILRLNNQVMEEAREKADKLGLGEQDQVTRSREFHKAMSDIKDVALGVSNTIGQALMPQLTRLGNWVGEKGGTIVSWTQKWLDVANKLKEAWAESSSPIMAILRAWEKINAQQQGRTSSGKVGGLPPAPGSPDDGSGGGGGGKTYVPKPSYDLVKAWETQLEQMKLASQKFALEEGESFVKYPLEQEAKFWQSKIALTRAGSNERFAVQKKAFDAELQLNQNAFNGRIASLVKEEEALKFDYDARIAKAREIAEAEARAYGAQDARAQIAAARIVQIEQEKAEKLRKVGEQITEQQKQRALAEIAVEETAVKVAFETRQISKTQQVQMEAELEKRRNAIEVAAVQERIRAIQALPGNLQDPAELQRLYAELERLAVQHEKAMGQIGLEGAQEYSKYMIQARDSVQSAFATMGSDIITRTSSWSDAFKNFARSVIKSMADILAQNFAQRLFGPGSAGGNFVANLVGAMIPKFDVGTPYVPRDMLAFVHKGEAIIPAGANAAGDGQYGTVSINQYFDNRGADDAAVAKLGALAQKIKTDAYTAVLSDLRRNGPIRRTN